MQKQETQNNIIIHAQAIADLKADENFTNWMKAGKHHFDQLLLIMQWDLPNQYHDAEIIGRSTKIYSDIRRMGEFLASSETSIGSTKPAGKRL